MRLLHWFGLLFLAALFIAVFVTVLNLRLSKGDIYPHYSTYRGDPLGSSGLMESIQASGIVQVDRNLIELEKHLGLDEDTTIFLNGIPRSEFEWLDKKIFEKEAELRKAVEKGARLVMTINPGVVPKNYDDWWAVKLKAAEEEKKKQLSAKRKTVPAKKKKPTPSTSPPPTTTAPSLVAAILDIGFQGLSLAELEKFERPDDGWAVNLSKRAKKYKLEKAPVWKSHLRFEVKKGEGWVPVVLVGGKPVVMEKKVGKGMIVATTDAYFTSNEALYSGADSEFLLYLVGSKTKLLFDETLHGTIDTPGVMEMVRRFRLQGVFIGLLIFLILWAWRSSNSLSPINESLDRGLIDSEGSVMGEGSNSGLIKLLKKSVPQKGLIHRCLAVWQSSHVADLSPDKQQELNEIHRRYPEGAEPEEHYQKVAEVLKRR